eukprot:9474754-Pyramimonas_sp.AAC.1
MTSLLTPCPPRPPLFLLLPPPAPAPPPHAFVKAWVRWQCQKCQESATSVSLIAACSRVCPGAQRGPTSFPTMAGVVVREL